MTDWNLRRRDLLKHLGAGAALLPVLRATRSFAAAPVFPRRLVIVVSPNGYPEDQFLPRGEGESLADLTLSETMSPLNPWKQDLIFLDALQCPNSWGDHDAYAMMLTGTPPIEGSTKDADGKDKYGTPSSATVDQIIGAEVTARANLPLRTLPLAAPFGTDTYENTNESTRSFWSGKAQPVTPEHSPYKVIDNLLAGKPQGDPTMERIRAEEKSILDFLGRDLEQFGQRLGSEDKLGVQQHLQAVRDLEHQLAALGQSVSACGETALPQPAGPRLDPGPTDNYRAILGLHMDLLVAALKCDVTRVATLQMGSSFGNRLFFSWLGIDGPAVNDPAMSGFIGRVWHDIGHAEMGRDGKNDKVTSDKWLMGQLAALLARLAGVPEVGPYSKTMLDDTVVLWANTMWNGVHDRKIPWLLAGKCGGYFKTGQYLRSSRGSSVNRVMADLCNAMDVPRTSFGTGQVTGPLPGLRA